MANSEEIVSGIKSNNEQIKQPIQELMYDTMPGYLLDVDPWKPAIDKGFLLKYMPKYLCDEEAGKTPKKTGYMSDYLDRKKFLHSVDNKVDCYDSVLQNVKDPEKDNDAVNKKYLEDSVSKVSSQLSAQVAASSNSEFYKYESGKGTFTSKYWLNNEPIYVFPFQYNCNTQDDLKKMSSPFSIDLKDAIQILDYNFTLSYILNGVEYTYKLPFHYGALQLFTPVIQFTLDPTTKKITKSELIFNGISIESLGTLTNIKIAGTITYIRDAKVLGQIRTEKPNASNKYYIQQSYRIKGSSTIMGLNPYSAEDKSTGLVIPNCVAYVYGRYMEAYNLTSCPLPETNANKWYGTIIKGAEYLGPEETPKPGGILCWDATRAGKIGHVAFVEKVESDQSVIVTDSWSGHSDHAFMQIRLHRGNGNGNESFWATSGERLSGDLGSVTVGSEYKYQGCLYLPPQ